MKLNFVLLAVLASVILLAASLASAQTAKVLFYESDKVSKDYRIGDGYSVFKQALEAKGYSVERYEGILTRADLDNYDPDVLVIAGLTKSLNADELAAVFEFVMQKQKGLFICGGTSAANQVTIPFGMAVDEAGTLEDETNPVVDSSTATPLEEKTSFSVSGLERQDPSLKVLVQGVSSLAFFEGNGISLSGDAKMVASGDWDTYSPKSSTFPKGSRPPIASAVLVGNGMVFLLSDPDMLLDESLDTSKYKYDNLRFGTNIVDWLRSPRSGPGVNKEVEELRLMIGQFSVDVDFMNNRTIQNLSSQIQVSEANIVKYTGDNANAKKEYDDAAAGKLVLSPDLGFSYIVLAMAGASVLLFAFAVIMSSKQKTEKKAAEAPSGFGYEFDGGGVGSSDAFSAKIEGFDGAMGAEKKK